MIVVGIHCYFTNTSYRCWSLFWQNFVVVIRCLNLSTTFHPDGSLQLPKIQHEAQIRSPLWWFVSFCNRHQVRKTSFLGPNCTFSQVHKRSLYPSPRSRTCNPTWIPQSNGSSATEIRPSSNKPWQHLQDSATESLETLRFLSQHFLHMSSQAFKGCRSLAFG